MRPIRLTFLAVALAFALPWAPAMSRADTPETVEFATEGHKDVVKLKGYLYRPTGNGPFPAIVALHNCDGLGSNQEPVAARYRDWAERLVTAGFVVLFPRQLRPAQSRPPVQRRPAQPALRTRAGPGRRPPRATGCNSRPTSPPTASR